jgi:hypothetical protein
MDAVAQSDTTRLLKIISMAMHSRTYLVKLKVSRGCSPLNLILYYHTTAAPKPILVESLLFISMNFKSLQVILFTTFASLASGYPSRYPVFTSVCDNHHNEQGK